jgi:hypothetical protein
MSYRVFCFLACVSFIFPNAYGMEEDPTVSLKPSYKFKNDPPAEKLWTDSQGCSIKQKNKVWISSKKSHCGASDSTCYANYFEISLPEESLTYVKSFIFATSDSERRYYVGLGYDLNDEDITEQMNENLKSDIYCPCVRESKQGNICTIYFENYNQYSFGQFLYALVSLQLLPRGLITDLLEKSQMVIQIDDFNISKKLLTTRISNKCWAVVDNDCPLSSTYRYSYHKSSLYNQHYLGLAIEELEKIEIPRQRAILAWEIGTDIHDEAKYKGEDLLKLYDLISEESLPYYRDARRKQAWIKLKSVKKDEDFLPFIRMFLEFNEPRDHRSAAQVARSYLNIKAYLYEVLQELSVSAEGIVTLLSLLGKEKSTVKDNKIRKEVESLVAHVREPKESEERQARLQELLQQNLNCEVIIKVCDQLKTLGMPLSEEVRKTRIRERLAFEISEAGSKSYLTAIGGLLALKRKSALSKANELATVYLNIYCPGEELKDDLSVSMETIFILLDLVRNAHKETSKLALES